MRCHPRRPTSSGSSTSRENKVLVCDRVNGSIGCSVSPGRANFPVKTARPIAAATPQRKAADPMKKYPRKGWLGLEVDEIRFPAPNPMMEPDRAVGQEARDQIR